MGTNLLSANGKHRQKRFRSILLEFLVSISFSVILLIATFILLFQIIVKKNTLIEVESESDLLSLAADEIVSDSKKLTEMCRLFIITQNTNALKSYYNIVKYRSGEIPRPNTVDPRLFPNTRITTISMYKKLGATDKEIKLLQKSLSLSSKLCDREMQAIDSISKNIYAPGNYKPLPGESIRDFAIRITYDIDYYKDSLLVMEPIKEFLNQLEERTHNKVYVAKQQLEIMIICSLISLALVTASIILLVVKLNKHVILPILKTSKAFSYLENGDLTKEMDIEISNGIGKMASEFNDTIKNLNN